MVAPIGVKNFDFVFVQVTISYIFLRQIAFSTISKK